MRCKLCGNDKLVKIKTIKVTEIQDYYDYYDIDISRYFNGDEFFLYQCTRCQVKSFVNALPGDSEFYEHLSKFSWYYEEDKEEFKKAIELIFKYNPRKILEIGAGFGFFLEKIKEAYEVKASEYSKKAIESLKSKGISLDNESDTYDFIVCFQVMEHIDNLEEFLAFVDKKLEFGGHVFICVPNNDSDFFKETFSALDYPPHHMHQFNEYALKYVAKILNYAIVDYWTESLRIEHYTDQIRNRRKKIKNIFQIGGNMLWDRISTKIIDLLDYLLLPYFYNNKVNGHTHGILLKKEVM